MSVTIGNALNSSLRYFVVAQAQREETTTTGEYEYVEDQSQSGYIDIIEYPGYIGQVNLV